MERICSQCHAVLSQALPGQAVPDNETAADWCPSCGGALVERENRIPGSPLAAPAEVDHRGIVLPRRHALGGIITPQ